MKEIRNFDIELRNQPDSRLVEGIIYKYTSPNGKCYIGQTTSPKNRKFQHQKCYDDTYFHRAIQKYGFDSFRYEVLISFKATNENKLNVLLDTLEKFYIRKFNSSNRNYGYNLTLGGGGAIGYKHTKEAKKKMSDFQKGKIPWNKGVPMLEEQKEKLRNIEHYWARGANCKVARKVAKYDNKMNLLEIYGTVTEAADSIGKKASAISYALKNNKPYNNFYWIYYEGNQK